MTSPWLRTVLSHRVASPRLHTVLHPWGHGPAAPHCPKKTIARHLGCPTPEGHSNTSLPPALGTWHPNSVPSVGLGDNTPSLLVSPPYRTAAVPVSSTPSTTPAPLVALHRPTRAPHSLLGGVTKPGTPFFPQGNPGAVSHKPQAAAELQPSFKTRQSRVETGAAARPRSCSAPAEPREAAGPRGLWILWWLIRGSTHAAIRSRAIA